MYVSLKRYKMCPWCDTKYRCRQRCFGATKTPRTDCISHQTPASSLVCSFPHRTLPVAKPRHRTLAFRQCLILFPLGKQKMNPLDICLLLRARQDVLAASGAAITRKQGFLCAFLGEQRVSAAVPSVALGAVQPPWGQ